MKSIEWLRRLDKRWQRSRGAEKRQVLVDARTAMNYATVAPVVEGLQKDSRVKIFFTSSESPDLLEKIYADAQPPYQLVRARLPRGTRRVQTFHGVAGKYRKVYDSPADSMRGWDRLFFINKRRLQNYIDTGAIDADSPAIRLIGMPRLDCLVDGSLERNQILTSLGIDPSRKTVLYAPTWSRYSSVALMGEEIVKRLGAAGYAVIVKLHDRSRQADDFHSGGVDWGQRLAPLLQANGGVLATGSICYLIVRWSAFTCRSCWKRRISNRATCS
jgi:CDP-glycerol glycerophosphotransferase (TagB/SpsB family)